MGTCHAGQASCPDSADSSICHLHCHSRWPVGAIIAQGRVERQLHQIILECRLHCGMGSWVSDDVSDDSPMTQRPPHVAVPTITQDARSPYVWASPGALPRWNRARHPGSGRAGAPSRQWAWPPPAAARIAPCLRMRGECGLRQANAAVVACPGAHG